MTTCVSLAILGGANFMFAPLFFEFNPYFSAIPPLGMICAEKDNSGIVGCSMFAGSLLESSLRVAS
jgi:hypothetical protein